MYAQEREARIRHRVDQVLHLVLALLSEVVVVAAEADDLLLHLGAILAREAIALQPTAEDHVARGVRAFGGAHHGVLACLIGSQELLTQAHAAVGLTCGRDAGHLLGGTPEIDDAGAAHTHPGDALTVRLDLADLLWSDPFHAFDAVGDAGVVDLLQARQFVLVGGHDEFAAYIVLNAMLLGEGDEFAASGNTILGLEAAGLVVDAAVDDPAVVAGLVIGERFLLFEQQDAQVGEPRLHLIQGGRTYDASTHDHHIPVRLFAHRFRLRSRRYLAPVYATGQ